MNWKNLLLPNSLAKNGFVSKKLGPTMTGKKSDQGCAEVSLDINFLPKIEVMKKLWINAAVYN